MINLVRQRHPLFNLVFNILNFVPCHHLCGMKKLNPVYFQVIIFTGFRDFKRFYENEHNLVIKTDETF